MCSPLEDGDPLTNWAQYALNFVALAVYNIFFHPLKHIPGPFWATSSRIAYCQHLINGTIADYVMELHARYGEVVRVAPDEVSFTSGETAWQDIYGQCELQVCAHTLSDNYFTGFHTGATKKPPFLKSPIWFRPQVNGVRSLISADPDTHSRMRRSMAHAFSDKAIKDQEEFVLGYVDKLIEGLRGQINAGSNGLVNLVSWYNWTTFDIIGDLVWGESFQCLEEHSETAFVKMMFNSIHALSQLHALHYFSILQWLKNWLLPPESHEAIRQRLVFFELAHAKTAKRLASGGERPDIMSHITRARAEKSLSVPEIDANSVTLMAAGSETTATMSSGTTYALLKNPKVLKKLQAEIRGTFRSGEQITMETVTNLPYLEAVIHEGLRVSILALALSALTSHQANIYVLVLPACPYGFPENCPRRRCYYQRLLHPGRHVRVCFTTGRLPQQSEL